jgi:hypothetical protein
MINKIMWNIRKKGGALRLQLLSQSEEILLYLTLGKKFCPNLAIAGIKVPNIDHIYFSDSLFYQLSISKIMWDIRKKAAH